MEKGVGEIIIMRMSEGKLAEEKAAGGGLGDYLFIRGG